MRLPWSFVRGTVVLAFIAGCPETGSETNYNCPPQTPSVAPPALEGLSDSLSLGAARYHLTCSLNRDFMPVSPPDGKPMSAFAYLISVDSLAVPDSLKLEHLWALVPDSYWSSDLFQEDRSHLPVDRIAGFTGCGPKWEPGSLADVVVRIRCGPDSAADLLVRDVRISRSD